VLSARLLTAAQAKRSPAISLNTTLQFLFKLEILVMWLRRTFHECADELEMVSQSFRTAFTNSSRVDQQRRGEILQDSSEKGVEILRILALSIHPEQDYDAAFKNATQYITVGALKDSVSNKYIFEVINSYQPTYSKKPGFKQLRLRDTFNCFLPRTNERCNLASWHIPTS